MKKSIKVLAMAVACAAACALPMACNSDNKQPENQPDTPEVQRQEFTVTFRNGDNVTREQVESGATVTRPNNPSKDGHRFLGWYLNNVEYDFTTPITGNLVLEAKWEVETYTVRFVTNGAGEIASQDVVYQGYATRPEQAPRKDGHTFANWYADEGCTVLFDFDADEITQNTTIYAGWTTDSYTVTFDTDDGSVVNPQNITYQEPATEPEDPEKTGYTFRYWYENNAEVAYDFSTPINGPKTLHAKWERISYSVEFINNGVVYETTPVYYGETVSAPANNPSDATNSHNFAGWYADSGCTTEFNFSQQIKSANVKVYAKWVLKTYQVTFNTNGGSAVVSASIQHGEKVTRPVNNPTKDNCVFDGWYADSDCTTEFDFNQAITSAEIVYAKWLNVYRLTFVKNNNEPDVVVEVVEGRTAQAPAAPSKDGHCFQGWFDAGHHEFSASTPTNGNATYTAEWERIEYTVMFDTCGGVMSDASEITKYYGDTVEEPSDPTWDDFTFQGWYTDENCTTEFTFDADEITNNTTLYAKWNITGYYEFEIDDDRDNYNIKKYHNIRNVTAITLPSTYYGYPVNYIADNAFNNCHWLQSVVIPNSIQYFGTDAFSCCSDLRSVNIPNGVKTISDSMFAGCSSLSEITIPNTVTSIGDYAFYDCYCLEQIEIPDSVTSIDRYAFFYCNLESVIIPNSVTHIGSVAFSENVDAEFYCEATEKPDDWEIDWCYSYNFTARVFWHGNWDYDNGIPTPTASNVGSLDAMKFFNTWDGDIDISCLSEEGLQYALQFDSLNVVIPNGVTSICGEWNNSASYVSAFSYGLGGGSDEWFEFAPRVVSVSLPDSLKTIGDGAFSRCNSLTSITIPASVESMGEYVFYGCDNLTTIYCYAVPNENWDANWLGECAAEVVWRFDMADLFEYELNQDGESYKITNTKSGINWDLIEEVTLPTQYNGKPITTIGNSAFNYEHLSPKSIIIPNGYTTIDDCAFFDNGYLTSIIIPNSVTHIGENVFAGCLNELEIRCASDVYESHENWDCGYTVVDIRNN